MFSAAAENMVYQYVGLASARASFLALKSTKRGQCCVLVL